MRRDRRLWRCAVGALSTLCVVTNPLASAAQSSVESSSPARVTLREAVASALDRGAAVADARSAMDQAALSLRLARSAFDVKVLPGLVGAFGQTSLSNQTYGVNVSQKFLSGTEISSIVGATSYRNQLGTYYNTETTLQVTQPLLRGFGSNVNKRSLLDAEWRITDTTRQLVAAERQMAIDVASAYYAIAVQMRLVDVARSALERAASLRDASQARLATGRVSQLDALRAQQLAGQAEGQLLDAQGSLADARDRLAILIGMRVGQDFSIDPQIPTDVEPLDVEHAVALALERRTELQAATDSLAESRRAIDAARNELRPQIDVGLALTRPTTANQLESALGFSGFRVATLATVNTPLDHTSADVALQNAIIERSRRARELDAVRDRITLEARQAMRRQDRADRSLALARAAVGVAERQVEIATTRFQLGISNNLDVVEAQSTLRSAQGQEAAAQAEVAVARLSLRAATGLLNPREDFR